MRPWIILAGMFVAMQSSFTGRRAHPAPGSADGPLKPAFGLSGTFEHVFIVTDGRARSEGARILGGTTK
jgi:hypothetical protein